MGSGRAVLTGPGLAARGRAGRWPGPEWRERLGAAWSSGCVWLQGLSPRCPPDGRPGSRREAEQTACPRAPRHTALVKRTQRGSESTRGPWGQRRADATLRRAAVPEPTSPFRHAATKGILVAMVCTFFEAFNVPVFWPILVMYFVMLFCITMKRQIKVQASRPRGRRRGAGGSGSEGGSGS